MLPSALPPPARTALRSLLSHASASHRLLQFAPPPPPSPSPPSPPAASNALHHALAQGALMSDAFVERIVAHRLQQPDCHARGWILDGFPRSAAQAARLMDGPWRPAVAVELAVDPHCLRSRLLLRGERAGRSDDCPAVIERRLHQFERYAPDVRLVLQQHHLPLVRVRAAERDAAHRVFDAVRDAVGDARRVLIMGAPGCGKGTQAALLSAHNGCVHVSSGDLLRNLHAASSSR